jgi:hypothetical protein
MGTIGTGDIITITATTGAAGNDEEQCAAHGFSERNV